MDKTDYDKFRILKFMHKANMIKRSSLTREALGRFPHLNMKTLYALVDSMEADGYINHFFEHIPGRRGPTPKVYLVTLGGIAWLKKKRKETNQLIKKLK